MASSRASLHPPRSAEETALIERFNAAPTDKARGAAFAAFEKTGLPHRRIEGWRWTDVRAAVRKIDDASAPRPDPFVKLGKEFAFAPASGVPRALDEAEHAPLAALAVALSGTDATHTIDIGKPTVEPIRLCFDTAATPFRHVVIRVREGVEAEVVETYLAGRGFGSVALVYQLDAGARLNRSVFQAGSDGAVQATTALVQLGKGARFEQTTLALGAKLARIETRVDHLVGGSHAVLNGAYLVGDGLHTDTTSHVVHSAPGCTTRQTIKGVARKGGKGVFQGKFLVARDAQKTDAQMEHHALLLEDGAEVNAKPELEIYADDVICAHGNSVGALDEAALFYMRQRGLPLDQARAILIEGFIAEAFEAAPVAARDALMQEARRWLLASA